MLARCRLLTFQDDAGLFYAAEIYIMDAFWEIYSFLEPTFYLFYV